MDKHYTSAIMQISSICPQIYGTSVSKKVWAVRWQRFGQAVHGLVYTNIHIPLRDALVETIKNG